MLEISSTFEEWEKQFLFSTLDEFILFQVSGSAFLLGHQSFTSSTVLPQVAFPQPYIPSSVLQFMLGIDVVFLEVLVPVPFCG